MKLNLYTRLLKRLFIVSIFSISLVLSINNTYAKKPNFILIMADDLGYGDISCFGNSRINTPNIDKLASEGIKFTDFHSNGAVCSPTRAALLTGKYQQRTGVEGVVTAAKHRHVGLSINEITIADELKKHDYTCGIFGKWHLGYSSEFNPRLQGFDEFTGFVSGNVDFHSHIDQEGYLDWWKDTIIDNETGYTTDLITRYGVEFIKKNKDKPFFLYLPHEAPHYPYQKREDKPVRKVGVRGSIKIPADSIPEIYKEMVEIMDEGIGKIMQALKETETDKNTVVIFCSDNGANKYGNNGILRGNKGDLFEGGHRVPAIAWYPGKFKGGSICDETIMTMDILPTILDFTGNAPTSEIVDGISLIKVLLEGISLPERDLFWSYKNKDAVRSGEWKLVTQTNNGNKNFKLFNLRNDLSEKNDLASMHPDIVEELYHKLNTWSKEARKDIISVAK